MSLLKHAWEIYREKGAVELMSRSISYIREHGFSWFLAHLISETFIGSHAKYVISHSSILTAIYFWARRTFKHEQRAILRGHRKYHQNERKQENPQHRIIRHPHMREKGISMRDRRDVFGVEIANELVDNVMEAGEE